MIEVVTDGEAAIESAEARHPDVVLMDVQMPGVDGLEATRRIHRAASGTKVILLSGHDDDIALARAVEAGARGYLKKTQAVSDLADAIRRAYPASRCTRSQRSSSLARFRMQRRTDGELAQRVERLTPRELEILQRVATGKPSSEIAEELDESSHAPDPHPERADEARRALEDRRRRRGDPVRQGQDERIGPGARVRRVLSDPVASASRGGACAADPQRQYFRSSSRSRSFTRFLTV